MGANPASAEKIPELFRHGPGSGERVEPGRWADSPSANMASTIADEYGASRRSRSAELEKIVKANSNNSQEVEGMPQEDTGGCRESLVTILTHQIG